MGETSPMKLLQEDDVNVGLAESSGEVPELGQGSVVGGARGEDCRNRSAANVPGQGRLTCLVGGGARGVNVVSNVAREVYQREGMGIGCSSAVKVRPRGLKLDQMNNGAHVWLPIRRRRPSLRCKYFCWAGVEAAVMEDGHAAQRIDQRLQGSLVARLEPSGEEASIAESGAYGLEGASVAGGCQGDGVGCEEPQLKVTPRGSKGGVVGMSKRGEQGVGAIGLANAVESAVDLAEAVSEAPAVITLRGWRWRRWGGRCAGRRG